MSKDFLTDEEMAAMESQSKDAPDFISDEDMQKFEQTTPTTPTTYPTPKTAKRSMPEIRQEIANQYGVDVGWLKDRQIGMGYVDEDEQKDSYGKGEYLQPTIDAGVGAVTSVMGEGLLGGFPTWLNKKLSDDNEAAAIDTLRHEVDKRKNGIDKGREIILSGIPAAKAVKAIGYGSKAAKVRQATLGVGESARAGLMESDEGKELESARDGMEIGAVFEALPYVGKVAGQAKRLFPGTKNALPKVNKATAHAGAIMPWQSASADDLYNLLSKPEVRRDVRKMDFIDEADKLARRVDDSFTNIDDTVSKAYSNLEDTFRAMPDSNRSLSALEDWTNKEFMNFATKVEKHPDFYSPLTKKAISKVSKTIVGKSPGTGPTRSMAGNLLEARRELDELYKNKDIHKLNRHDRDLVLEMRDSINTTMRKKVDGGEFIAQADELFSGVADKLKGLKNRITKKGQEGVNVTKLKHDLLSQGVRRREFENEFKKAGEVFEQLKAVNEKNPGMIPDEIINDFAEKFNDMKQFSDLGKHKAMLESLERAGGGPTSQIINAAGQIQGAISTGGFTAPFFPVTNPAGYMRMLDEASGLPPKIQKVLEGAARRGSNSLAVTHYLLMQQEPDYRNYVKQLEQEEDKQKARDQFINQGSPAK